MIRAALAALATALLASSVLAQTNWTGATSNSWNLPSNWDNGIPDGATDAIIPSTATIFPSVFTGNPTANGLTIEVGATLTLSAGWDLTVNGDLLIDGALTNTATSSNLEVVGAWTNNGSFANGGSNVELSGTGSLGGTSLTTFHNLTVSAGVRTCTAAFAVGADVEVQGGATLDVGSFTHTVVGNWTSSGGGAVVSGTGTLEFTGAGFLTTLGNGVPNVDVSGGVRSVNSSTISGNLTMSAGQIQILDFTTLTVNGFVNLTGGTLGWDGTFVGDDVLDVAGNVTITAAAGSTAADSIIQCAGDWSSTSAFSPAAGVVVLDGPGAQAVGGLSPTFADLGVASGTCTVNSATVVAGDLTLASGSAMVSAASLDVNGDAILGDGSANWDLGAFTHTVAGFYFSAGANASGLGTVELDGTGTLATSGGSIANVSVTAGTRTASDTIVAGDLSLSGAGVLEIADDQTLLVQGNANLTGGTLQWFSVGSGIQDVLDVDGDVVLTSAFGQGSTNSVMRVGGSWSSSSAFTPTVGAVIFDGGAASTIDGASPTFHNLTITNGAETLNSAASIGGDLLIGGGVTLTLAAGLTVTGNSTINGTLDLVDQTLAAGGNWTGDFFGASVTSTTGSVDFTGDGSMITGANSIPDVTVSGGVRSTFISTIDGDLAVTAGTLEIQDNSTLTVNGAATLGVGAILAFDSVLGGLETFNVLGSVVIDGTAGAMSPSAFIQCGGSWNSAATWIPSAGTVRLGGGVDTTVDATNFANVSVDNGIKTFGTACAISGNLTVVSGATLDADAVLDVDGFVTLGDATAAWDLGSLTHTVAGNYTSIGASASGVGGAIEFDGPGTVGAGGGAIENVVVSSGVRTCNPTNLAITNNLDLTGSATLQIANDRTITVGGNALLTSGTLAWFGSATGADEVLDIEGDATVMAAYGGGSANSRLRVAGNWTSSSAFAPTAGVVELDGGTATTINGTTPTFRSLTIMDGAKTLLASAQVTGDLTVQAGHSLTLSLADLTVAGSVLVDGSLDLASGTVAAAGSWTSNAGSASIIGPGTIDLTASGVLSAGLNPLPDVIVSGGFRSSQDAIITGSLNVTAGTFVVQDDSTVTVASDLNVAVGGFLGFVGALPGPEILDVEGNVAINGSNGTSTAASSFHCAGNWVSDAAYAPALGEVVLDGGTVTTFGGVAPNLADLRVASGTKTMTVDTLLFGDLTVDSGATLDSDGVVTVGGSVSLGDATASWDIDALNHTVVGDYTSGGASAVGSGSLEFTADGSANTGTGSIPNAMLSGGVRLCQDMSVIGDVDVSAGSMRIDNDALVSVGGNLAVTGGILEWSPNGSGVEDVLDVEGDVTLDVTAASGLSSANTRLRVAGNYSAEAGFAPGDGVVELDGGTTTTVSGTPTFPNLRIVSGIKTLSVAAIIDSDLTIEDGATLDTQGALNIGGAATLGDATASWLAGALTHTLSGSYVSSGASMTGGATLLLNSTGDLATGGGTVDSVIVSGGTRSVQDVALLGGLSVIGGTVEVQDNASVDVGGNLGLGFGTTLVFDDLTAGAETIDVTGDVTMQGTAGAMTANSIILCEGSWSANGNWVPTAGTVTLDGAVLTGLSGLSPDNTTAFFGLVLLNGVREVTNDLTLDIETLLVEVSAELRIGSRQVVVPGSTITNDGLVEIGAGGELAMGPAAVMTVTTGGTLSMIGASGNRASMAGTGGGGYALLINGTLEARQYHFGGMGVNGIVLSRNAALGTAPNNMDIGLFDDPSSAPGSVLLSMYRTAPTTFRYVDFDGAGTAAFNVTTLFGSPITFENSNGDFAGEANDNDPSNLVSWTDNSTQLLDFSASPQASLTVKVDWESSVEVDAMDYVLMRAASEAGPFVTVDDQPATGPGAYTFTDTAADGTFFVYRLFERLIHGDLHLLAQDDVVLFGGPALGLRADNRRVSEQNRGAAPAPVALSSLAPAPGLPSSSDAAVTGSDGGTWDDLQGALNAAMLHDPVIVVAPGRYPAFTVQPGFTGTLRIVADGTGLVEIDTSAAALRVLDLPAGVAVELSGLHIGALSIEASQGLVLVDEGSLEHVTVRDSARVVVQRAQVGEAAVHASTVAFGGGALASLAVDQLSFVRTAGVSVDAVVESGSRWLATTQQPEVRAPDLVGLGESFPVVFRGQPHSDVALFLSLGLRWWDPIAAGQSGHDGLLLVDLAAGQWSEMRQLDALGQIGFQTQLPLELAGVPVVLQMANQDPQTGRLSWSNAASIVVPGESGVLYVSPSTPILETPEQELTTEGPSAGH